ncbi:MAG: hypothetical protein P8L44_16895 [Opitutales bacterium]|nr:hypothetical protein [Opitutales bacterium]
MNYRHRPGAGKRDFLLNVMPEIPFETNTLCKHLKGDIRQVWRGLFQRLVLDLTTAVFLSLSSRSLNISAMVEFIPLPSTGEREKYTGLTRGRLNALVLPNRNNDYRAPVRSVSLKELGKARGTRLIDFNSLMEYLYSRCRYEAVPDHYPD